MRRGGRAALLGCLASAAVAGGGFDPRGPRALDGMLASLQTCPAQRYGAGPWAAGLPTGHRFSPPGARLRTQPAEFNPAGFMVAAIAIMMIAALAGQQGVSGQISLSGGQPLPPGQNPLGTLLGQLISGQPGPFPPPVPGAYPGGVTTNPVKPPGTSAPGAGAPGGTVPGATTPGGRVPVSLPNLTSASQVSMQNLRPILEAGGYLSRTAQAQNSGDPIQKGLKAMGWGWTFRRQRQNLSLDSRPSRGDRPMRDYVFAEYEMMKAAYARYSNVPNLSQEGASQLFGQFVAGVASGLNTSGSADAKTRLISAQLNVESGRKHWTNFRLTRSYAGAGGASQVMPGHLNGSHGQGKNYYDPADAFAMHVSILNDYLRRARGSVRNGLAMYNGGPGGYRRAGPQAYARRIMQQAGW